VLRDQFSAVIEQDREWFVAYCLEIPGANGQGHMREEAVGSLSDAIALVLETG
jgi:predicted RNase H-like HicB family nuclease